MEPNANYHLYIKRPMYICVCFTKTEKDLLTVLDKHKCSEVEELCKISECGTRCGRCRIAIARMIEENVKNGKLE